MWVSKSGLCSVQSAIGRPQELIVHNHRTDQIRTVEWATGMVYWAGCATALR